MDHPRKIKGCSFQNTLLLLLLLLLFDIKVENLLFYDIRDFCLAHIILISLKFQMNDRWTKKGMFNHPSKISIENFVLIQADTLDSINFINFNYRAAGPLRESSQSVKIPR